MIGMPQDPPEGYGQDLIKKQPEGMNVGSLVSMG